MTRLAALAVALLVFGGCGRSATITNGGVVVGEAVTVYSLLPAEGPRVAAAEDVVLGEKLALFEAGGVAGEKKVNLVSRRVPAGRRAIADAVRDAIHDQQIIAAIADLDSGSARVSVPLLNAAGVLHLSPGATYTGLVAPVGAIDPDAPLRYAPARGATFAPLLPTDAAQAAAIARAARGRVAVEAESGSAEAAALAAAVNRLVDPARGTDRVGTYVYVGSDAVNARGVIEGMLRESRRARVLVSGGLAGTGLLEDLGSPRVAIVTPAGPANQDPRFATAFEERFGRAPGPFALVGYRAMRGVLDAIAAAGERGGVRRRVIDEYFKANPPGEVASAPVFLETSRGFEPL